MPECGRRKGRELRGCREQRQRRTVGTSRHGRNFFYHLVRLQMFAGSSSPTPLRAIEARRLDALLCVGLGSGSES
jgi:hypothetical protein